MSGSNTLSDSQSFHCQAPISHYSSFHMGSHYNKMMDGPSCWLEKKRDWLYAIVSDVASYLYGYNYQPILSIIFHFLSQFDLEFSSLYFLHPQDSTFTGPTQTHLSDSNWNLIQDVPRADHLINQHQAKLVGMHHYPTKLHLQPVTPSHRPKQPWTSPRTRGQSNTSTHTPTYQLMYHSVTLTSSI